MHIVKIKNNNQKNDFKKLSKFFIIIKSDSFLYFHLIITS